MSTLQDLLVALEDVSQSAERFSAQLAQRAKSLGQAASLTAATARQASRPDGVQAAASLQAAHRATSRAALHLHQAALVGHRFAAAHSTGGAGDIGVGGGDQGGQVAPRNEAGVKSDASSRYLLPSAAQQSGLTKAVSRFGAKGISSWIGHVNPNYSSGESAWTNNCGSCARAVAATYQGVSTDAATGDAQQPPGEYEEMWSALGIRPTTSLANEGRGTKPDNFTTDAYSTLEARLRQERPGAVAIIGVDWDHPRLPQGEAGGHWFNAYVDEFGAVRWADGQPGQEGAWPPGYAVPICRLEAVVRSSSGEPWKEIVL